MAKPYENPLCVALDSSDRSWILEVASAVAGEVGWLKIGLEAFIAHGPSLVDEVADLGRPVFLDLKLHDIPATVQRAAANCASWGVHMITVHASGGRIMMEAAVEGARSGGRASPPKIVAVTVLTSLDHEAFEDLGWSRPPHETVLRLSQLAQRSGVDGVVVSGLEASAVRSAIGDDFLIVTPGIRPSADPADDQRRVAAPAAALRAGATIIVVGRSITRAPDPVAAARRIREELASGD